MFTGNGEKLTSENIQAHCCKIRDFPELRVTYWQTVVKPEAYWILRVLVEDTEIDTETLTTWPASGKSQEQCD